MIKLFFFIYWHLCVFAVIGGKSCMQLNGYKSAFLRAIFSLVFQFVGQLTVKWVSYHEVIINLINKVKNDSFKIEITAQIPEKIFLCPTTKQVYGIINPFF